MRKPLDSPFSPGADTIPDVWAGRTRQLSDWRDVLRPRRLAGLPERGRTILGEAGSGKSSLVRRITADGERRGDLVTSQLRIPTGTDPIKRVAEALLQLAGQAGLPMKTEKRLTELIGRVEAVAVSGVSLALRAGEGPEAYRSLTELLVEIGRAAMRNDVAVVLHLDEVQNMLDDKVLSQLLIALGDALAFTEPVEAPGGHVIDRALPIIVYLTGLPEFADMAGARKGATFARRFMRTFLEAIDDDALMEALQPFVAEGWQILSDAGRPERVWMEPTAQRLIVDLSCGEPFLFQLAGERAWYAGTDNVITADDVRRGWDDAASEAESHVQRILDRLPGREREFIEAMAELPPDDRSLTNIADAAGLQKVTDAGPTSQRLDVVRGIIARGRPYRFRHRAVEAMLTTSWPR